MSDWLVSSLRLDVETLEGRLDRSLARERELMKRVSEAELLCHRLRGAYSAMLGIYSTNRTSSSAKEEFPFPWEKA
jgi:hypothetical protein